MQKTIYAPAQHEVIMALLSEHMRPTIATCHALVGSARRIWDRQCSQWLQHNHYHFILWGPPGSGKTTLGRLLGEASGLPFVALSAVRDGVKEIRQAVDKQPGCILFIDEIHRLNKAQQDTLLPILEYTQAWVIGATTEPPNTVLSAPVLSRVRNIYVGPHNENDINLGLNNALGFLYKEFPNMNQESRLNYEEKVIPKISKISDGDLRFAINLLENIWHCGSIEEENEIYKNSLKAFTNKKHYDYISAMIKSMRGSDPDAALFYGITALDEGEDPLFILRRCIIFASEDVGNADPAALTLALNAYRAVECVGMPEGRIPLAQCITYLASTLKSNRAYVAIEKVREWKKQAVERGLDTSPPIPLTAKGREQYKYPHNYPEAFVTFDYLPDAISDIKNKEKKPAYMPANIGLEARFLERLASIWKKTNA